MNYRNNPPILNSFPPVEKEAAKSGFTLVELIVVITILAILGTIAFISLQGYSRDARDSIRISDLSTMKTSLELFNLDAGKYPVTTDGFQITYSGSEVWTQGEFGVDTTNNVDRLDETPTDPLTKKKYTYSTTINKQEFQLAGLVEGSDLGLYNGILSEANAGETVATAIVTGNYNGMMLKTSTGGVNCAILALPSIISNKDSSVTDVVDILTNSGLVYTGYNNIPSNYIGSKYKVDEGFEFIGNNLVAYSDADSCSELYNADDNAARVELITGLQNSYSGTIIANEGIISTIVNVDTSNDDAVALLGTTLVNNSFGGEIIASNDGGATSSFSCGDTVSAGGYTYTTELILGNGGYQECWTTQNMNHGDMLLNGTTMPSDINTIEKWCYNNNISNECDIGGGLYTWSEAMGFDSSCNTINCIQAEDTTKSVCGQLGTGWKLPTEVQWTDLTDGGATGWTGNKLFGMNSSLLGFRDKNTIFKNSSTETYWWVSNEFDVNRSKLRYLYYTTNSVYTNNDDKTSGYSILCIKN